VMDIGAMSPGGNSPGATEICHEGIRIPGIKLVDRGELRKDFFDAFINMTRQPVMVGLDLKCEIAANNVAKSRIQALYEQFGAELVTAVSQEMLNYSEAILRKRIAEIPDGTWSDTGTIHAGDTWKVHVTLNKKGDRLLFDFTGSSPQANISIRVYFTLDGSQAASSYVLEKWWDQSGVATVSAPTLVSGSTYYFNVSYGTASLPAGGAWEFHTAMHLSNWSSNFSSANDWWRNTGTLPASYSDWSRFPAYAGSTLVWGSIP